MFFKIQDVHIQSILSVIPKKKNKVKEDDHIKRVKRVIGVKSSRRAQDRVTTVDLFIEASHKIIKKAWAQLSNPKAMSSTTSTTKI